MSIPTAKRCFIIIEILVIAFLLDSCSFITKQVGNEMDSFCWKYTQTTKNNDTSSEFIHTLADEAKNIKQNVFFSWTKEKNRIDFLKCYIELCDKLDFKETKTKLVKEYNILVKKNDNEIPYNASSHHPAQAPLLRNVEEQNNKKTTPSMSGKTSPPTQASRKTTSQTNRSNSKKIKKDSETKRSKPEYTSLDVLTNW